MQIFSIRFPDISTPESDLLASFRFALAAIFRRHKLEKFLELLTRKIEREFKRLIYEVKVLRRDTHTAAAACWE